MNNEKVINRLRNACGIIILILIAIMAALQVVAPNVLRRVIMCHFILLLIYINSLKIISSAYALIEFIVLTQ